MSNAHTAETDTCEYIRYEVPAPGVARVVLARAEKRNAQDKRMLYELNSQFDRACHDDDIRVIILAADGPDFSSGHDLRDPSTMAEFTPVGNWGGYELPGSEGYFAQEHEYYLELCWRWRDMPKPTIAQVQGRAIAGALMLIWPCDLIVASEDATFSDPVVAFGLNGHEFFVHAWELGARRAKELLFTGAAITAEEGRALGMVNRVVPLAELEAATLALAERIAEQPTIGIKLAKMSVNQSLDAQGMRSSVQSAFALHHLGHAHYVQIHGHADDPAATSAIRELSRKPGGSTTDGASSESAQSQE
jgi:enoyl-CoA hydratase